jgi:hypothetical protein
MSCSILYLNRINLLSRYQTNNLPYTDTKLQFIRHGNTQIIQFAPHSKHCLHYKEELVNAMWENNRCLL